MESFDKSKYHTIRATQVTLTVNEYYILELSQEIKLQSVLRQYFMFRKKVKQFSCLRHISYMIQNK